MNDHQGARFHFNRNKIFLIIFWRWLIKMDPILISNKSPYKPIWSDEKIVTLMTWFSCSRAREKTNRKRFFTFMGSGNSPKATIFKCCILQSKPKSSASWRFSTQKRVILVWHYFTTNTWLLKEKLLQIMTIKKQACIVTSSIKTEESHQVNHQHITSVLVDLKI